MFLISMEDEIMQLFGSEKIIDTMEAYDIPEDEYISGQSLDRAFKKAQDFVESKNLDSRLYLYKYDSVTSFQRKSLYKFRDSLLENEANFLEFLDRCVEEVVVEITDLADPKMISKEMLSVFRVDAKPEEISGSLGLSVAQPADTTVNEWLNPFYTAPKDSEKFLTARAKLVSYMQKLALKIKNDKEVYAAAQNLILEVIDNHWSGQLELMDILKEGANLFSYASQDPLIDYIKEGAKLFQHMESNLKRQFLTAIFTLLEQRGEIN